ncbi:MarR family transcriptional regulator [Celeribacter naphthalenivorans]|uniref:MarR family transcriptional regulator n=1 Tax=Celeribacter naphthalenivorans TaxID=1614694 RepID=UPI001CFC43FF|nr:helix-turn-helix domain-containing protein [Celeribacter naphthalenivorans]
MMDETRPISVLTGDLVNSTGLGPENVERAFRALEDCAEMQADWMGGQSLHFTRHRGDGWQVALAEPKYTLRSALFFRASIRALGRDFDSYIGMAEGIVAKPISVNLNGANFPVFVSSGRALDHAKSWKHRMVFNEHAYANGASILLDRISREWTPTQAQALALAIEPEQDVTLSEIAQRLGKTRQAISKSLSAAWHFETLEALKNFESNYNG